MYYNKLRKRFEVYSLQGITTGGLTLLLSVL